MQRYSFSLLNIEIYDIFQFDIVGLCSCFKAHYYSASFLGVDTAVVCNSSVIKLSSITREKKRNEQYKPSRNQTPLIIHLKSKYEVKVMTEMLWAISEKNWRQVMKSNPFSFPWVLAF